MLCFYGKSLRRLLRRLRLLHGWLSFICCPVVLADNAFLGAAQGHQAIAGWVDTHCQSFAEARLEYAQRLVDSQFLDNRFALYQGLRIAQIEYVRLDVFDTEDPKESNALYRFVNSLNILTRKSVLQERVLFEVGERLDPAAVAETERILRGLPFLSDAFVMPIAACDGEVHLAVIAKDAWTTQPILSASREGGEDRSRLGFIEGNFLGTGSEVSVVLTEDEERSLRSYGFSKEYLLGKPLGVRFRLSDSNDGYIRNASIGKPYYTENTQNAFDTSIRQSQLRETIKLNGDTLAAYDVTIDRKTVRASWLWSKSYSGILRYYIGASRHEERYDDFVGEVSLNPQMMDDLNYGWVAIEYLSKRYKIMSNIDYIGALEDIQLGANMYVSVGYSPKSDNAQSALVLEGRYSQRWLLNRNIFSVGATFDGTQYAEHQGDSYLSGAFAEYRFLLDARQRFYSRAFYQKAKPLGLHNALSLGGVNGSRGYPANFILGDQLAGASFEYRYHSDLHLFNIIRVGAVAYWDVAVLENDTFPIDNNGYAGKPLSSLGFGLRIASSKTHVGNVVHIDIAAPASSSSAKNVDSYQLLLRAENRF